MSIRRQEAVRAIIPVGAVPVRTEGSAFAPVNIALAKYWGKRDEELNLPITDSFSVSLCLGTRTVVQRAAGTEDSVILDGKAVGKDRPFYERLVRFLDLFRPEEKIFFHIDTQNMVPTAAGLASSASGFAALVLALDQFFGWGCTKEQLSCLARLGSGSACRSIYPGFVYWKGGKHEHGIDSFAAPFPATWPELSLGMLLVSTKEKPLGSTAAMQRSVQTSPLYGAWPNKVEGDILEIMAAIQKKDFARFGKTVEQNALAMHATMLTSWPPLCYWTAETVAAMRAVWTAREQGVPLFFTMDAGPNIKLLFLREQQAAVRALFPGMVDAPVWWG